jgi:hypothetical protein
VACGGFGPELGLEGHHSSLQSWTGDGRGKCLVPMRIGCAVPAPAVGRAWLPLCPLREGARGVSVTSGQQGLLFVVEGLKALGGVGAYRCTEFSPKCCAGVLSPSQNQSEAACRGCNRYCDRRIGCKSE